MAKKFSVYQYKETRLDLDSAIQDSTVSIRLQGTSTWSKANYRVGGIAVATDEDAFRRQHLASASSIYSRTHHKSPRSFLWRVLEDGKVLSLRAIDISKQSDDAFLTLRFTFPGAIRPACITFADSKEHDVLSVFVLLESNHLYTLTLRPDDFRKPSSTENRFADLSKSYASSPLGIKHPHRMVALAADEILISLYDGGLLKLVRKSGGDGLQWKETFYNEGGWGQGLRSLIPFQANNTYRHGKLNMEHSAIISVASPSTKINEFEYVFTVTIDHRLRVWNLTSGRIAFTIDLLSREFDPNDQTRPVIHPAHSNLVQVYRSDDEDDICVTYSPTGSGQFKLWQITPAHEGKLELIDLCPDVTLEPPAPTPDVWTVADFSFVLDHMKVDKYTIWVLWKNNTAYRLQCLTFQMGNDRRLKDSWKHGWVSVAAETSSDSALPQSPSSDPTRSWLEYILYPGRFTTATIETALALRQGTKGSAKRSGPLVERLCSTLASTSSLDRKADGGMDYERFTKAADDQWRSFCRFLNDIDKLRGEALSLVIHPGNDMPWVILADGVSATRECSRMEQVWHNQNESPASLEDVVALVSAAASLREGVPIQFRNSFSATILAELCEESSEIEPTKMRLIYEKCDFSSQISDEDYDDLIGRLGDFKRVTPSVYEAILEAMTAFGNFDKRPHRLSLAEFGRKLVIESVQEVVPLHRSVCLDQLMLLIFIEVEINHTEDGIQFETGAVCRQLLITLRRLELLRWLTSQQIAVPLVNESLFTTHKPVEVITVFEGILRHLLSLDTRHGESTSAALTSLAIHICAPTSEYELISSTIQCFLLTQERPDLALEFARFVENDSFSTYAQARTLLASGDALGASALFKKSAFGLAYSRSKKRIDHNSAGLLDATEKKLLNAGLPEFYSHIVALYDKKKIYSHVIDFARLSLQFLRPNNEEPNTKALRAEMHSRLFNAAIQTSQWDVAHSTLSLLADSALQHSSLRFLVTRMCESQSASQLIDLPFIGLQDRVDDILAQKCQSIVDVVNGIAYHKILYAWRIKRNDFRGATAISFERLERLQSSGLADKKLGGELETPVTSQYIALINTLSCVDPKQAWILAEEQNIKPGKGLKGSVAVTQPRRSVITLEDVRRGYQGELDRLAAIENNQFTFGGDDNLEML